MQELNGSKINKELPPDSTPISTEQLFAIIGELTVQVKVLQAMLKRELDSAVEKRSLQSKDN